jgi:hypothetical protein
MIAHVHDVEFPKHQSSINLDCKVTVVCDGVFGNLSIGGSDQERGGKAMGFDAMLLDEHPMDECGISPMSFLTAFEAVPFLHIVFLVSLR